MKKQKQGKLLCGLCLALLLIPLVGMLAFGPSDAVSNERLAAKPRLWRGGQLNADVLSETADYFAGRFFLRRRSSLRTAPYRRPYSGNRRPRTWYWAKTAGSFTRTHWMIFRGQIP